MTILQDVLVTASLLFVIYVLAQTAWEGPHFHTLNILYYHFGLDMRPYCDEKLSFLNAMLSMVWIFTDFMIDSVLTVFKAISYPLFKQTVMLMYGGINE